MPKKETAIATKGSENTSAVKYDASNIYAEMSDEEIALIQGTTGTEDLPENERRIPLIVWNLEKDKQSGNILQKGQFYNVRTGEQMDQIVCSLLGFSRIRDFTQIEKSTGTKTTVCRSTNLEFGTRLSGDDPGKEFPCEGCPYRRSERIGERKMCVEVFTIAAFDLEKREIFVFRATRSSHVPFTNYLERNFFNKVEIKGKKRDLPLYMGVTRITLAADEGANNSVFYAPVFEMVKIHDSKTVIMELYEMANRVRKMKIADIADTAETHSDASRTEFDPEKFD